MRRHAFTLIELLVVIAIIGLLGTIAIVAIGASRVKARNAKRVADIRQLVTAFELGINASSDGLYPLSSTDQWSCVSSSCYGAWAGYGADATVNSFLATSLPNKPTDPNEGNVRGLGGYVYNGAATAPFPLGSVIAYTLEKPSTCSLGQNFGSYSDYTECVVLLNE